MRIHPLLLLLACNNDKAGETGAPDDTGVPQDTDTGEPVDTDTGPGPDTDTDTDTESGDSRPTGDATLGFALSGDWEGTTLTLTWFDPTAGYAWSYGDQIASEAVSAETVEVDVTAPSTDALIELDPENAPGMLVALYAPALHVDADGDGELSGDETYLGVGQIWPVWVEGDIPSAWSSAGVLEGWNALSYAAEGEPPTAGDASAIPLDAGFTLAESVTVGGTWEGGDTDGVRLVLFPGTVLAGGSVDEVLYNEPLSDPWEISLAGEPPEDHFASMDGYSGSLALELPYTFADNDGNEELSWGDETLYFACYGDAAVGVAWLPPPADLQAGYLMASAGLSPGWAALAVSGSGFTAVPEDERGALNLSDACGVGF